MAIQNSSQLEFVALAHLREHPLAQRLSKQHSIPPFLPVPQKLLLPAGLLSLRHQLIFDVVASKDRYYCITNLRLLALLQPLPPSTAICVRICRLKEEDIAQRILRDLLILPVLTGVAKRDVPRLALLWERLQTQPVFTGLFRKTGAIGLGHLLRTRFRSLPRSPYV